jgi:hypothetical protein
MPSTGDKAIGGTSRSARRSRTRPPRCASSSLPGARPILSSPSGGFSETASEQSTHRSDTTEVSLVEGDRAALPLQAANSTRDLPDLAHPTSSGRHHAEGGMMSDARLDRPRGEAGRRTGPAGRPQPGGTATPKKQRTEIDSLGSLASEDLASVAMWGARAASGRSGPAHLCSRSTRRMSEEVIARDVHPSYDGRWTARAEDRPGRGIADPPQPRHVRV